MCPYNSGGPQMSDLTCALTTQADLTCGRQRSDLTCALTTKACSLKSVPAYSSELASSWLCTHERASSHPQPLASYPCACPKANICVPRFIMGEKSKYIDDDGNVIK